MTHSIQKIRDRQLAAPTLSETLQDLVINELKEKKHVATEGLLWLSRYVHITAEIISRFYHYRQLTSRFLQFSALDFTAQALRQNLTKSSEELADSFRAAYGNTLKPHHSFIVKPIFSAAMSATPYRKDFYAKLGEDQSKVEADMGKWLEALEKVISVLKTFMASKDAKW